MDFFQKEKRVNGCLEAVVLGHSSVRRKYIDVKSLYLSFILQEKYAGGVE